MAKFTLNKTISGGYVISHNRGHCIEHLSIEASDLADLYSCVGAALAEHNSGVMGAGECKCALRDAIDRPVCGKGFIQLDHANPANFDYCANKHGDGSYCGHDEACHSTQSTKDQEQDK